MHEFFNQTDMASALHVKLNAATLIITLACASYPRSDFFSRQSDKVGLKSTLQGLGLHIFMMFRNSGYGDSCLHRSILLCRTTP